MTIATNRKQESFLVRRVGPGDARKDYGPFGERVEAEIVAQRSAEKYRGASVWVEPSGASTAKDPS